MTDKFTIQCQSCGTLYNDLQDVCPYCGEPQPLIGEEPPFLPDKSLPEVDLEDELLKDELLKDELLKDELLKNKLGEGQEALQSDAIHISPSKQPSPQEYHLEADLHLADDEYLGQENYPAAENPFGDDDIFAIAGEDDETEAYHEFDPLDETDEFSEYDEYDYEEGDEVEYDDELDPYHHPASPDFDEFDEAEYPQDEIREPYAPRRFTFRRMFVGCLGLMICMGLLYGGIGVLAVQQGLRERTENNITESQQHYQKGQEYLANNAIELAIAEFERALILNPTFSAAKQALREAQRIAQSQPTPTSETRSAAVAQFLGQAEDLIAQQQWAEAIQILLQVRGLDPDYQPEQVSNLLYSSNYQLGLQFVAAQQIEEALPAFEQALLERPDDLEAIQEQAKAALYLKGIAAEQEDIQKAVEFFAELYALDENYSDTKQHFWQAHELYGDELNKSKSWCQAEIQYLEANKVQSSTTLETKAKTVGAKCTANAPAATPTPSNPSSGQANATPSTKPTTAANTTAKATATIEAEAEAEIPPPSAASGAILYAAYNPSEAHWEIISVPLNGGSPKVLVTNATMPAVSPNKQLLLYHAELIDAEGLHVLDLTSDQDKRITQQATHILPRWGGNDQFLFSAQETGTGRWQVHQGFADGKSDPLTLRDGRTPDWSTNGNFMAYQGTDDEGNNPGIYLVPFAGGEATRITSHQSDRSPAFSPDGSQLAFMSTRNGNWDLYTVNVANPTPLRVTTSAGNEGLPMWSPDGSKLAYVSDAAGSWAIYIIEAEGGSPFKVTEWDGGKREDWLLGQIWWTK